VRRVLVIQDVGLWIDLNRHLSGVASVDLVEAMSFGLGQLLAQIERPRVVVYGPEADGPGPDALVREFRAAGVDEVDIVAIDPAAGEPQLEQGSSAPIVCTQERLAEVVSGLLALADPEPEPMVELLAHYEVADTEGGDATRGFAVILELSDRSLVMESDVPLDTGSELSLNFFLADPGSTSQRAKISMSCLVARCRDEAKLIYSARVSKMTDSARELVQRHATLGPGGGV